MRAPGVYADIDIDAYHAEEGISSSGITQILDCPKRYWSEYIAKRAEKTDSKCRDKYLIGRAVHMLVLEPKKFSDTFFVMTEEVNLTTKPGKIIYEAARQHAAGRQVIRKSDWDEISQMAESIKQHSLWTDISLEKGYCEHSVYWDGGRYDWDTAVYDTRLRARPDFYHDSMIIDLKTTENIAFFGRSVYSYGYHRQAAMQIDGLKAIDGKDRVFAFFVVEKKAPYLTAVFVLDDKSLELGREEYLKGAEIYSECMKSNHWPGYAESFKLLTLPKYLIKEEDANE